MSSTSIAELAESLGFEQESCRDLSGSLTLHYRKMIASVRTNADEMVARGGATIAPGATVWATGWRCARRATSRRGSGAS